MTGRVLIVEDQRALRRVQELSLAASGCQIDTAVNGPSALDVAKRHQPRLIILGRGLPGMDGLEVITGVRAVSGVSIPVVSARDAGLAQLGGMNAGASDYLAKPASMGWSPGPGHTRGSQGREGTGQSPGNR